MVTEVAKSFSRVVVKDYVVLLYSARAYIFLQKELDTLYVELSFEMYTSIPLLSRAI